MAEGRKSKGSRKVGRDKKACEAYAAAHMREKNKLRKLRAHVKRLPNDVAAKKAMDRVILEQYGGRK